MIHTLLKTNEISVKALIKHYNSVTSQGNSGHTSFDTYTFHNPISFIWHCLKIDHSSEHYKLVKLLLMHGGNPLSLNEERLYISQGLTKNLKTKTSIPVKDYLLTKNSSLMSQKILSLIYLGCTEHCLQAKSVNQKEAKNYLQKSHELSAEVFQEYATEVITKKQGFSLLYDEDKKTIFIDILKNCELLKHVDTQTHTKKS